MFTNFLIDQGQANPGQAVNDSGENDYFYCENCNEEYYLPEDTIFCPFCGATDIELA